MHEVAMAALAPAIDEACPLQIGYQLPNLWRMATVYPTTASPNATLVRDTFLLRKRALIPGVRT
jgi:hypothetical protein